MRNPLRLKKIAQTGLPARAYPLETRHVSTPDGAEAGWLGGQIIIIWRVEVEGRPPYEFEDQVDAPGWIEPGHRGKRAWNVRWRHNHGLLKDLGVPCRVDPEDPHFLAIDWDAGYDEHQKAWDELDARMRHVSRRRGGLDGLIDKVALRGAPEVDAEEAEKLDRAVDDYGRQTAEAEEAAWQPSEPVLGLMVERDGLQAQMDEIKRLNKKGRKVPATIVSCEPTGAEVSGLPVWAIRAELHEPDAAPRTIDQQLALAKLSTRSLKPGKDITARVDPDDPARIALI